MLKETLDEVKSYREPECFAFYDKYFTKEHAKYIKDLAMPAEYMRNHITTIISFYIPEIAERKRTGRIFNKTRNQVSLSAYNIKKLAAKDYYKEFDNRELEQINTTKLLYHPILLMVTQKGTYFKRPNRATGRDSKGITYFQYHKASRIRAKAKNKYYGCGLDEEILQLSTEELIEHPIFNVTTSITKHKKKEIVKNIVGEERC